MNLEEMLRDYSEKLPEANSEAILESCRNSAGIRVSHFPDYSDLADELYENNPGTLEGSSWMRDEVDKRVLEYLRKVSEERTLNASRRKVILGKPTRKKFGIRKYRKFRNS